MLGRDIIQNVNCMGKTPDVLAYRRCTVCMSSSWTVYYAHMSNMDSVCYIFGTLCKESLTVSFICNNQLSAIMW